MTDFSTYKQHVAGDLEFPEILEKLYEFEQKHGGQTYSDCFCLDAEHMFDGYFNDIKSDNGMLAQYKKHIRVFAVSDGSGGYYAFWIKDDKIRLEDAPIVCYSSEGDIRIVAKNIRDLLRLLTFDAEIVDGTAFRDDDDERSENHHVFVKWLKEEFNLDPVGDVIVIEAEGICYSRDVQKIVCDAQDMFQDDFMSWHAKYEYIECEFSTVPVDSVKQPSDIDLSDLPDMLYHSVDSPEIENFFTKLGIPSVEENKKNRSRLMLHEATLGLELYFKKIKSVYNPKGELVLRMVGLEYSPLAFPFDLKPEDNLAKVENKIGKKAEYASKYIKAMFKWKCVNKDGKNYLLSTIFSDKNEFSNIERVAVDTFIPESEYKIQHEKLL
ncbi:MAG: hypothetical protein ACWA40_01845 [Planktomarina sp.]